MSKIVVFSTQIVGLQIQTEPLSELEISNRGRDHLTYRILTGLQAQTLAAAQARLTAAGFGPDMAEWVCEQAAIDYPGYDETWAQAVVGDVEALCTDPDSFDDGGQI